jgi:hypothetical protein
MSPSPGLGAFEQLSLRKEKQHTSGSKERSVHRRRRRRGRRRRTRAAAGGQGDQGEQKRPGKLSARITDRDKDSRVFW